MPGCTSAVFQPITENGGPMTLRIRNDPTSAAVRGYAVDSQNTVIWLELAPQHPKTVGAIWAERAVRGLGSRWLRRAGHTPRHRRGCRGLKNAPRPETGPAGPDPPRVVGGCGIAHRSSCSRIVGIIVARSSLGGVRIHEPPESIIDPFFVCFYNTHMAYAYRHSAGQPLNRAGFFRPDHDPPLAF